MNSKKLVSLISASALAASSFASLAMPAFAEDEVLFTDTFNKYENAVAHMKESVGNVFLDGTYNAASTSKDIAGLTLVTTNRADDSSYYQIKDKDEEGTDKYLQTQTSRFARQSAGAHIDFDTTYAAASGKDVVLAFDIKETNEKHTTYDDAFSIGSAIIDMAAANINDGEWHKLKVVVSTGGTSVYADGGEEAIASSADTSISSIRFNSYVGGVIANDAQQSAVKDEEGNNVLGDDGKPIHYYFGYPTWGFDNMVVYTSADGVNSDIPTAEDNDATPAPTATPVPDAAPIENTSETIDFDEYDFDALEIPVSTHKDYTTVTTAEGSTVGDGSNDSIVYSIAQTSEKDNAYAYATIDLSSMTAGKSHIIIDYDIFVGASGRVKVVFADGALTTGKATETNSLFTQGVTKSNDQSNCKTDAWVHTSVDVDLSTGAGTYTVTNLDGSSVSSGKFTTDLEALTTMSLISWSPNTSYLDNIKIQTGGELEAKETPEPTEVAKVATPEPASSVEGSFIELKPEDARSFDNPDVTAVEGASAEVKNHSDAKQAQAGSFDTYSDKVKGNSIFVTYDAYVGENDKLTFAGYGDGGKALGPQFVLEGKADGTVAVSGVGDKGDIVKADNTLSADTWYRVVIETPQTSGGATGTSKFTVYRIDPADPTKTTEAAASAEVGPRNLSGRGMTSVKVSVEGTPYIDNLAAYFMSSGSDEPIETDEPAEVTPEPASDVEGSFIGLEPASAKESFNSENILGESEEVKNHSDARPAVEGSIATVTDKARGFSFFMAYDVYVAAGDKLSIAAANGTSIGTTFVIEGGENGAASVYALVNKGDKTSLGTLANETWYRVVIEVPQLNNDGNTNVGDATYTVYRIDPSDPENTAGVALKKSGLTPRNLSGRSMTSFNVSVTGKPYIDNVAAYRDDTTASTRVYKAKYNDAGKLLSVTSKVAAAETPVLTGTSKTFVWKIDSKNGMEPVPTE